jgi:hypothetical protein
MKKYLDIRNVIIVILILLALVEFLNPRGFMPGRTKLMTQIDSIPYPVHDTIPFETEIEVPVEIEVEVPVDRPVEVRVEVEKPVDTAAILKMFAENKQTKKDVLELPNNIGTVTVFDTISNNRILGRSFTSKVKKQIVKDTIYTPVPPKRLYYIGFDAKFDKPNMINLLGVSMMIKTKDEKIYKFGVGVQNIVGPDGVNGSLVPNIGGGVYWKINLRKGSK